MWSALSSDSETSLRHSECQQGTHVSLSSDELLWCGFIYSNPCMHPEEAMVLAKMVAKGACSQPANPSCWKASWIEPTERKVEWCKVDTKWLRRDGPCVCTSVRTATKKRNDSLHPSPFGVTLWADERNYQLPTLQTPLSLLRRNFYIATHTHSKTHDSSPSIMRSAWKLQGFEYNKGCLLSSLVEGDLSSFFQLPQEVGMIYFHFTSPRNRGVHETP